ncbi:fluoride efflux transporter FluC [Phocicoccus pinnipedialis]|uniref:Fluoride-specific ion channel FluC n=1 Tax=Phocicoccus pinnipedialis TaxID=110845 RepID=A0A6V7RBK3_9BACL|nr:CrcB family protein [Jeotgalicoccus pinnipedialis]MBP1939568.1 CrcB protein [Jeotgalicoccus pinnipedialis]CAD2074935.1 Putative fluoride ion transporter CrcB [Jeotgalicoccus pinnipedialis]
MSNMFLTIIAAGIGAIARDMVSEIMDGNSKFGTNGIKFVNYTGAFLMGVAAQIFLLNSSIYTLVTAGFLGGFTTFSTFALHQFRLLEDKDFSRFLKYTGQTFFFTLILFALGMIIGGIF